MTTPVYNIGQDARLEGEFRNIDGDLADPGAIDLTVREPDGTPTAKTKADMTSDTTGFWYYDFSCVQPGRHRFFFDGTSGVITAGGGEFYVLRKETN